MQFTSTIDKKSKQLNDETTNVSFGFYLQNSIFDS